MKGPSHHLQSDGQMERLIDTFKMLLKFKRKELSAKTQARFLWHIVARQTTEKSPVEDLFQRPRRTVRTERAPHKRQQATFEAAVHRPHCGTPAIVLHRGECVCEDTPKPLIQMARK